MEGGRPVPTQTITEGGPPGVGDAGDGERAGLALVIQETEAQSRLAVLARLAPGTDRLPFPPKTTFGSG